MWLTDSNLETLKVRNRIVVVGMDSRTKQTNLEGEEW